MSNLKRKHSFPIKHAAKADKSMHGPQPSQSSLVGGTSGSSLSLNNLKKKVIVEETDKTGAFAVQILPQDVSKQLLEMDVEDMERRLCEFFNFTEVATDLKEASILDYYVGAVWWAKEQGFNDQQTSCFFTACHLLLDNVKEKQMKLVDNVLELKKILVGVGAEVSGGLTNGGMELFDTEQGQAISKYIFNSLFQHYRLYEYMFQQTQDEEIIGTDLDIEVAKDAALPFPPPLDEGIEEEKFEAFLKTPPSTPTSEELQEEAGRKEKVDESFVGIDMNSEIFRQLTAQDVKEVVESVANVMLGGLQNEVLMKLREKENIILARINKLHIVAST